MTARLSWGAMSTLRCVTRWHLDACRLGSAHEGEGHPALHGAANGDFHLPRPPDGRHMPVVPCDSCLWYMHAPPAHFQWDASAPLPLVLQRWERQSGMTNPQLWCCRRLKLENIVLTSAHKLRHVKVTDCGLQELLDCMHQG